MAACLKAVTRKRLLLADMSHFTERQAPLPKLSLSHNPAYLPSERESFRLYGIH